MDPSFLRRQVLSQQAMALTTSLPTGQSFYTLESLEGASSLPFLKPAPPTSLPRRESLPPSLPLPLDRLDTQTRALLADREILDARARLFAAEREALPRNLPGGATALQDQRMYTDGLQASDARARVSLDGLQNLDVRSRTLLDNGRVLSHGLNARPGVPSLSDNRGLSHGLDMRPRDPLQPGVGNISRAPPVVGGIPPGATEHGSLSELLRARELSVGGPFLPAAGPTLVRRDIADWRTEVPKVAAQSARLNANGSREPPARRSGPAEANKVKYEAERNKGLSISQPSSAKSPAAKIKPPSEQSEGWCTVCKIDCNNIKTLGIHVNGRKHKAAVEQLQGNAVKLEGASKTVYKQAASKTVDKREANSTPLTSQAVKKRASDEKSEMSQSAKRIKASTPAVTSNKPTVASTDMKKAKDEPQKAKPMAVSNPSQHFCELCNISTTGKTNLESHLKGKRHAARVKELANPQLVVSVT